jgi:hypothetical protein
VLSAGSTIGDVCQTSVERLEEAGLSVKLRRFDRLSQINWRGGDATRVVVVSELAALPTRRLSVKLPQRAKLLVFRQEDEPLEALPVPIMNLNIHDPKRLHIVTRSTDDAAEALISRTISGFAADGGSGRIVDAWWDGDAFVILTPDFDRFPVPLANLSRILGKDRRVLSDFEIDADGSFVYWPRRDVHLGWDQFVCMTTEEALKTIQSLQSVFNRRYGKSIRTMREERALRQSDIRGLTSRQVGRIESGKSRATRSALLKFAASHGMSLPEYLQALADRA